MNLAVILLIALVFLCPLEGSAQQATDASLRRAAEELLPRVERLSGLQAKRPINVAARSRQQLKEYLGSQLEEEDSIEIASAELAYQRLGLLPEMPGSAIEGTLDLYAEQIAGYYDTKRDTLYVIKDVPIASIVPVLVHEMVHALQNQHVVLDSLVSRRGGGDRIMAARAAIEGHAMVVMWLFTAEERTGQTPSIADQPDMSLMPLEFFFPDNPMPMLESAPVVVREGFIFPYSRGAGFVQALWRKDPSAVPFDAFLPGSTEQIIDPPRLLDRRDAPVEIFFDDIAPAGVSTVDPTVLPNRSEKVWSSLYENTLGQFELSVLLKVRHMQIGAEKYAAGWAGDRYVLLGDGGHEVLLWYLVWDDRQSAAAFSSAYRQILGQRLNKTAGLEELTIGGKPAVRIIEAEEGVDLSTIPRPQVRLAAQRN